MRPIKFRAWHQPTGKIYRVRSINFTFENGVAATLDQYPYEGDKRFTTLKFDKLMQFTGLLDKNGKEIYEGDILKSGKTEACVEWDQAGYWAIGTFANSLSSSHAEVIGNIHENPELLK